MIKGRQGLVAAARQTREHLKMAGVHIINTPLVNSAGPKGASKYIFAGGWGFAGSRTRFPGLPL